MMSPVSHIGVGMVSLASLVMLIYTKERSMVNFIIEKFISPMIKRKQS